MNELFQQLHPLLIATALCTPRLLATFLIAPFFNTDMINGITRNCIVLVFSLILFPVMLPYVRGHELSLGLVLATAVKEAILGALIGYLAGLFFYAIEAVGHIIDYQRGASFASVMDPATGEQSSPLGSFFIQTTVVLFFSSGGFILFLSGMYESYRVWPIATFWPRFDPEFVLFFLARIDEMTALTFLLVSPVLIALFLSELGLGLINRFAPQLNVFFLSMPIKSAVGMAILIVYLHFVLVFMKDNFIQRADIFSLLRQVVR